MSHAARAPLVVDHRRNRGQRLAGGADGEDARVRIAGAKAIGGLDRAQPDQLGGVVLRDAGLRDFEEDRRRRTPAQDEPGQTSGPQRGGDVAAGVRPRDGPGLRRPEDEAEAVRERDHGAVEWPDQHAQQAGGIERVGDGMLLVQDRNAEPATADERLLSALANRREAGLCRIEIEHEKRIHRRPLGSVRPRTAIARAPAARTPSEHNATGNPCIINSLSLNG